MGVMGLNILPCIVWKNTKESEHLTQIPKPYLSTSLSNILIQFSKNYAEFTFVSNKEILAMRKV